jgi:hypothetical protein
MYPSRIVNMAEKTEADDMSKITDPDNKNTATGTDQALLARRRLLKLGAYVPPAIIGMAIIGSIPASASAHGSTVGSCLPSACQPCVDVSLGKGGNIARNQCKVAQAKKSSGG